MDPCPVKQEFRMRLHIIRHGDPDYISDTLTPSGRHESECLRIWVARERPDRAYCSPLGRAHLTADIALAGSGLTVEVEPWIAELSDCLADGIPLAWWNVHGHLIRNRNYLASRQWSDLPHLATTRAESETARVAVDSDAFLARHGMIREGGIYRVGNTPWINLAVFCHGGIGLCWLAHLLEIPAPLLWSGFFMHTSSVTSVLFDERSPGIAAPRVIHFGDISHLSQSGVEPSLSGIIANHR